MISLAVPILGLDEKQAVLEVLESGWVTMGERVQQFEHGFAKLHGFDDAIAVNSCTAGLHVALVALGVGPSDEVLVPSLTFVAAINAIKYVGATPIFVDVESIYQPHISLSKAQDLITRKSVAVMIMHYGGYLCDVEAWRSFADKNKLVLIEDAAHSPACDGVAHQADITSFSFFSNKNMTTSEGGMLLAKEPELVASMRNLRSHGMTSVTLDRHKGHAYSYDVINLGFNYRMDEIRAAIGIEQLKKLPNWNRQRIELTKLYRAKLSEVGFLDMGIEIPFQDTDVTVGHLMPVLLPESVKRENVMDSLRQNGVQSSIHYPPAHKFTLYKDLYSNVSLPITESYCNRELSLPLHPTLNQVEIEKVCTELTRACSS